MTATDTPETFLDIKPSDERDEYEYITYVARFLEELIQQREQIDAVCTRP